jgi:hypothetical protein
MYIEGMRAMARCLVILTVLAIVGPFVPALACGQADSGSMPCCKASVPCDLGIGAGSCCRITSAPPSSIPAGMTMQPANPGRILPAHGPASTSGDATPYALVSLRFDRLWLPSAHDDSAPLFLRNASILR